jgi:hypothetical protein
MAMIQNLLPPVKLIGSVQSCVCGSHLSTLLLVFCVLPLSTKFLVFLFLYDKSDCNDNGASRMMKASDGIHSGGGFAGF